MGLKTKSFGKNEDRYLTVFKHSEPTTFEENIKYCSLDSIDQNLQQKIRDYLQKNPLNKEEIDILEQFATKRHPKSTLKPIRNHQLRRNECNPGKRGAGELLFSHRNLAKKCVFSDFRINLKIYL